MKYFIKLIISTLTILTLPSGGFSAEKKTLDLIKSQKNSTDLLHRPDDTLKSFDITTAQSPLNNVRVTNSLSQEVLIESPAHPGKRSADNDASELTIDPKALKGLLYPLQDTTPEEDTEPLALAPHTPLVTDLGNGAFLIDDSFENQVPTLIDMNKLAYAIGKRGTVDGDYDKLIKTLKKSLKDQGWDIREFQGKSGKRNRTDDTPGFVAYNKKQNTMTVILRGSQTREDETKSADWEVNFDAKLIDFPFGGKVHGGFYKRSLAMMPHIQDTIEGFLKEMDDDAKSTVKIMVSGHSQGAALASIVMPLLAEYFKAAQTFGSTFNNAENNILRGYFISAPRIYTDLSWINETAGAHNMIRQNVTGAFLSDPVPVASPGKTLRALMSLIPFVGEDLATQYGGKEGTKSVGYLAADWSRQAMTRTLGEDALSFLERRAKGSLLMLRDIGSGALKNPFDLLTLETQISLFKKLLQEPLTEGLSTLLAPLHYGSTSKQLEGGEALFGPQVVAGYTKTSPTMADLLAQGFQKKQSEKTGLSGRIRTGIEKLAQKKASLPDLPAAVSGIAQKVKKKKVKSKVKKSLKAAAKSAKHKLFGL